jgi:hypothetical protein
MRSISRADKMWVECGVGMERSAMTWPHIARKQVRSALPSRLLAAKRKQTWYAAYPRTPLFYIFIYTFVKI